MISLVLILAFSCTVEENGGEFTFYHKKGKIIVHNYQIRQTKLGNLYLLLNDEKQDTQINQINIDSMCYIFNGKKYKASLDRPNDKYHGFFISVKNDGKKLATPRINYDKERMYLIGHRDDLAFIIENNQIVFEH